MKCNYIIICAQTNRIEFTMSLDNTHNTMRVVSAWFIVLSVQILSLLSSLPSRKARLPLSEKLYVLLSLLKRVSTGRG